MMSKIGYRPAPVDVNRVSLGSDHEQVVDILAENEHNVWAKDRIKQGWTYGAQQDVKAKSSPYLVPYSLLDERTRHMGREGVREAVCTLLAYGYNLEPLHQEHKSATISKCRMFRPDKSYAVTKGKWYFEYEILTAGSMRVGWARPGCTAEKELGSDGQAFVYDGSEAQWYHQGGEPVGRVWARGDILGCLADLTERTMMVTLNGEVLFNDRGSEVAAKEFDIKDGPCLVSHILTQYTLFMFFNYFSVCGLQEGFKPFATCMARNPTLWMSWNKPQFRILGQCMFWSLNLPFRKGNPKTKNKCFFFSFYYFF
uniref:B30.2/SPRY domain-containing protein n=1 Tax=Gouania willdenowi TaxID=441366 RepID=A0A8C5G2H2_GOUWI